MSFGCLEADTGWDLGGFEARVVTRRGAGVVTRGGEEVSIGREVAGVTEGSGDTEGPGLEAA